METTPGDIVQFKKKHPCGGSRWQVVSIGTDIRLKCCTCDRHILLPRHEFERKIRSKSPGKPAHDDKA